MNTHSLRGGFRRRNLIPIFIVLASSLVVAYGLTAGGAQTQQDNAAASVENGREFESKVPERLPVKVKVKSEKSFKDLQNKGWFRELEVEVKNTGSKPIYYVHLSIHMPDVRIGGILYGASMRYGRRELFYPETPVEPGDVPIMPGESATLKFGEDG